MAYGITMVACGSIITLCELAFLILFRPPLKMFRGWWVIPSLYAKSIALMCLGARLVGLYLPNLGAASRLAWWERAYALVFTIIATVAVLVFFIGYLKERNWGAPILPGQLQRKKR